MTYRSLLFAPANHERRTEKALNGDADAVILDLEDAVEVGQKSRARARIEELLARARPSGPATFVRINGLTTSEAYDDLRAVAWPGLTGVMLPKAQSPQDIQVTDWMLSQLERERGLPLGAISVLPIVETASGVAQVASIAGASPRVRVLSFGAGDLSLDLGISPAADEVMLWARIQLVITSRAAGLEPPIDTVFTDLGDPEALRRQAQQARRIGFQGKACIHPSQVVVVNEVFTPSAGEIERARRVVEAFEAATRGGSAAIVVDGLFVDYPVAERARRVIAQTERLLDASLRQTGPV